MLKTGIKLGIALLISASMISCNGEEETVENNNNGARLMPVETVTIVEGDFEDFIRLTGTVEALEDATISAEASGRILSISDRGDRVQRGGVIARLDDRVIQAQFDAAKTGFELAEDTFNRLEALYADSIISTQDFRSSRAQRDQAKAQLNQAEKMLQDSNIEAPFSGRVEERMVRTGELINPGQPVVRLVNTDRVRILAGIPERYAGEIGEGSEAQVSIRSLGGDIFNSTISYAGNVIDPDTRTFTVEIELENPGERIKPDMVVDLRVKRSTLTNVIIIPRTAVLRDEEGVTVFRSADSNGRKVAELVNIRTGLASGALIQVLDGLEEGDEVVVSGMRTLSSGDELNVITNESNLERAERLREANRPTASF
ncbi:MAG: efflux RND transporter periplasmic adaptor subunit [Balneolaceae bacterium]|nr:efflux RND transporter periplasmic adaptor subunit [Balneolaceae bacterium]